MRRRLQIGALITLSLTGAIRKFVTSRVGTKRLDFTSIKQDDQWYIPANGHFIRLKEVSRYELFLSLNMEVVDKMILKYPNIASLYDFTSSFKQNTVRVHLRVQFTSLK